MKLRNIDDYDICDINLNGKYYDSYQYWSDYYDDYNSLYWNTYSDADPELDYESGEVLKTRPYIRFGSKSQSFGNYLVECIPTYSIEIIRMRKLESLLK